MRSREVQTSSSVASQFAPASRRVSTVARSAHFLRLQAACRAVCRLLYFVVVVIVIVVVPGKSPKQARVRFVGKGRLSKEVDAKPERNGFLDDRGVNFSDRSLSQCFIESGSRFF